MKLLTMIFATALLGLVGFGISSALADSQPKYGLTITITPSDEIKAKGGHDLVITPDKFEGHNAFTSKDECEMHFIMIDVLGIANAMAPLKLDEDYKLDYKCEIVGTAI